MSGPLVSVIIPCYNGARTLVHALESVRWQTYPAWECLIVDDGSEDDSTRIVERYAGIDNRFIVLHQPHQGLSAARNRGLETATGEYLQFLDADDLLVPDKIEVCLRHLQDRTELDAVYCNYALLSGRDHFFQTLPSRMPHDDQVKSLLFHWNIDFIIPVHAFLFRQRAFEGRQFDRNLGSRAEDVDCWIRMAMEGVTFDYIEHVGVVYRISAGSITSNEQQLISSKLVVAEWYRRNPELDRYAGEFTRFVHYLRCRLAIAHFMHKDFRNGFALMRQEWGPARWSARVKMTGWFLLMLVFSKQAVERFREWLVSRSRLRWGGWKQYRQWTPPKELVRLITS